MTQEKACVCRKVVSPYLTDDELCAVAHVIRILCGLGRNDTFDPVRALELIPFISTTYGWNIVAAEEWVFGEQTHGIFIPEKRCVYIHEAVYNRACGGNMQDKFTIAHEIAHLILYMLFGIEYSEPFNPFITEFTHNLKDCYGDPELQADAVAVYMFVLGDKADSHSIAEKVTQKPAYWVIVLCVALIAYIVLLHERGKEGEEKIAV